MVMVGCESNKLSLARGSSNVTSICEIDATRVWFWRNVSRLENPTVVSYVNASSWNVIRMAVVVGMSKKSSNMASSVDTSLRVTEYDESGNVTATFVGSRTSATGLSRIDRIVCALACH